MFRDAYRRFLAEEVVPHMERFREQGVVDREVFKKAGERGFLMVWPEERYGGMDDYDIRWEQVIIEELAYARCSDWFGSLHSRIVAPYITRFGSEDQIARYIPGAVSGDIILAVAMTSLTRAAIWRGCGPMRSRRLTTGCSMAKRPISQTVSTAIWWSSLPRPIRRITRMP